MLRSLGAAHIATAATVPEDLLSNFDGYFKAIVDACLHKAGTLPRPRRGAPRLYFRTSPEFVCDFEDSTRRHNAIMIGREGDRFNPNSFPALTTRRPSDKDFVIVLTFLRKDGSMTDALAAFAFDDKPIDDCADRVATSFGLSDDAHFIATRVMPMWERGVSSLNRHRKGLSLSRSAEACLVCQIAGRKLKSCSGCNMKLYCGARCQKLDWKRHQEVCRSVQKCLT